MDLLSSIPEITFDDVLLLPNRSDFPPAEENLKVGLETKVSKNISLAIPIVSSPMPGVTETEMAIALGRAGGMGFLHFSQSFDRQLDQVSQVKKAGVNVAASVTDFSNEGFKHIENLLHAGVDLISLEMGHAHNSQLVAFTRKLKTTYPTIELSAALVVTADATLELVKAGIDSVRVGIGGGSHCTTRLVTGIGRPQLSAVADCSKITRRHRIPLISDTGIKYAGDIPKALVFGADCVMIGGIFAGTLEAPGSIIKKNGRRYKYSWGMCTRSAMEQSHPPLTFSSQLRRLIVGSFKRLFQNPSTEVKDNFFEEGVEGLIPYKGSVRGELDALIGGVRRSMWYQGAHTIAELRKKARVVLISPATRLENAPRI